VYRYTYAVIYDATTFHPLTSNPLVIRNVVATTGYPQISGFCRWRWLPEVLAQRGRNAIIEVAGKDTVSELARRTNLKRDKSKRYLRILYIKGLHSYISNTRTHIFGRISCEKRRSSERKSCDSPLKCPLEIGKRCSRVLSVMWGGGEEKKKRTDNYLSKDSADYDLKRFHFIEIKRYIGEIKDYCYGKAAHTFFTILYPPCSGPRDSARARWLSKSIDYISLDRRFFHTKSSANYWFISIQNVMCYYTKLWYPYFQYFRSINNPAQLYF